MPVLSKIARSQHSPSHYFVLSITTGGPCSKFRHTRFEPSGWSTVKEIGYAKSLMDYLFRWLALRFLPAMSPAKTGAGTSDMAPAPAFPSLESAGDGDAPACKECGTIMTRNGVCYRCGNCGWTSGS